jgi:hypothetical protein
MERRGGPACPPRADTCVGPYMRALIRSTIFETRCL